MLLVVVLYNSIQMKAQLEAYKAREASLTEQIEEEKLRTQEIEEFEKYSQTKKYKEEVAREKLGLVYEDEILIETEE